MRRAACLLLAAFAGATGCGDDAGDKPPELDGTYRSVLTSAALERGFPGTNAPPGRWTMKIDTKLSFIEVGAPDGGGFSLEITSIGEGRVTLAGTACEAADGSPAGDAVYAIARAGRRLTFSTVRDRCADPDPEAALLRLRPWERDARATPERAPGY